MQLHLKENQATRMNSAILHYSAAPVVGGVEAVIQAHAEQFSAAGFPLTVIAGRGEASAMPQGVKFIRIGEIDSLHPDISAATRALNTGEIPESFEGLVDSLADRLKPILIEYDHLIIHNVMTKHFNLPLTAALFRLMDKGVIKHAIAWCHDMSWSSPNSRSKVYSSYPWELLKKGHDNITYVAVSKQRQKEVVKIFGIPSSKVPVVYNGVDPYTLAGLSKESIRLVERLGLLAADLILLMPVRVTEAKNIEFAIKLVAALKKFNCRPQLVITGPPDPHDRTSVAYYQSLLALRRRQGVEEEIHFVYESGPRLGDEYFIGQEVVSDLYRMADAMLMPSHREGFGMPVLEAGLLGVPIISTPVPALNEIARDKALAFSHTTSPERLAQKILDWINAKPEHLLRVKIRQNYTWKMIFEKDLVPLLRMEV